MILGMPENQPESSTANKKPFMYNKKNKKGTGRAKAKSNEDKEWQKHWPPSGWPMFEGVFSQKAIATRKLEDLNITQGASYSISYYKPSPRVVEYTLEIQEWSFDQAGQHRISSPLVIRFKNCPHNNTSHDQHPRCFNSMRLYGDEKQASNALETGNFALVAAYLASRIEKGLVPDIKRVLKLYKLI